MIGKEKAANLDVGAGLPILDGIAHKVQNGAIDQRSVADHHDGCPVIEYQPHICSGS